MFQKLAIEYIHCGWIRPWIEELEIGPVVTRIFLNSPDRYLVRPCDTPVTVESVVGYIERFFGRKIQEYVREYGSPYPGINSTSLLSDDVREDIAQIIMDYLAECVDEIKQ